MVKHPLTGSDMKLDPELEIKAARDPFCLSIEPINRPVFMYGWHLGTDERIAREFAEEIFRRYNDPANTLHPNGIYTVALIRSGRLYDCYDGRDWSSDLLYRMHDDDHAREIREQAARDHMPSAPFGWDVADTSHD